MKQITLCIVIILTCLSRSIVADLIGFKECQKRFGFSKKLKESQKIIEEEEDDIDDLDGYMNKQEEQNNISPSLINQELSEFYHCLKQLSNCYELIEAKPYDSSKVVPYQECFERCYNPKQFTTQLLKDLVEFSTNCAKNNLGIVINFQNINQDDLDPSMTKKQLKRLPWEVMVFGLMLSSIFIGWMNIDRIKKNFGLKKRMDGSDLVDLVEIYSLNPDYIARKRFEDNLRKSKAQNMNLLANIDSTYKQTIIKTKTLIKNENKEMDDAQKEELRSISKLDDENNYQQINQIAEVTTQHQSIDVLFNNLPENKKQTKSTSARKQQLQSPDQSLLNESNGLLHEHCDDDSYLDEFYQNNDPFDL